MKLSKKLAVILALVVLAFSLSACSKGAAPAEKNTVIMGEWTMDLNALNALAGVNTENFGDILYLVEDLSVVFEFTDDIVTTAQDAEAAYAEAEKQLADAKINMETTAAAVVKAEEAAAAAAEEEAADAEKALADARTAAEEAVKAVADAEAAVAQAKAAAETARAAADAQLEAAKAPGADFTQAGKMLIKVTANGETVVSEEAYTATYEEGNFRVSIGGAEPNFFRIEDGKLIIVAHE